MMAIVLADAMLEKFGGDSIREMRRNYDWYMEQLAARQAAIEGARGAADASSVADRTGI
jgi:hypothetical protein